MAETLTCPSCGSANEAGRKFCFTRGSEKTELALGVAQALRLPETVARSLTVKGILARAAGRPEEEFAFARHGVRYSLEHDLSAQNLVSSYGNLSDACLRVDRYDDALEALGEALPLARRGGDRGAEHYVLSETSYALTMIGRWDEAVGLFEQLPEDELRTNVAVSSVLTGVLEICLHRGDLDRARELHGMFGHIEDTSEIQDRAIHRAASAALLRAEGRLEEAILAGAEASEALAVPQAAKQGLVWAVESALALGDEPRADELLTPVEQLAPGLRPPFLEAQAQRFRARMAGDEDVLRAAAAIFREYGNTFWLAVTLLEHGELTGDDSSFTEAREVFERLRATPWLERIAARSGHSEAIA